MELKIAVFFININLMMMMTMTIWWSEATRLLEFNRWKCARRRSQKSEKSQIWPPTIETGKYNTSQYIYGCTWQKKKSDIVLSKFREMASVLGLSNS